MKALKPIALISFAFVLLGAKKNDGLRAKFYRVSHSVPSFISEGVFIGGEVSSPSSLLKVKLLKGINGNPKERIYFQTGDEEGRVGGKTTYFHISVESDPSRIVLDFANLKKTAIGPEEVRAALKGSRFVKEAMITMDPVDHSTNITMTLSSPKKVAAFFWEKKPGRLYLEIKPEENKK